MTETRPKPALLCILDGWGIRPEQADNAIALARTPHWDRLLATCPHAAVDTAGAAVGLPDGQMGNSEVGHMNIGAGRIVMQDLPRIDAAIADGSLARNETLTRLIAAAKAATGTVHLIGLISPGGVHSHQDHIAALARVLSAGGLAVRIHALTDGRDTPPSSAPGFLDAFEAAIADLPDVAIATLGGRYYAMDRDQRWERVAKACDAIVLGRGEAASSARAAIAASHARGVTDEFIVPAVIDGYRGMADGDAVLMANFRADRMRQIVSALGDPDFNGFARTRFAKLSALAGMVEYSDAIAAFCPALFPPETIAMTLGETVARAGLTQLRIAETEKYAHVTFFLNGGREAVFAGEARILVPSPKVATYDLKPEMSAPEVTDRLVEAIGSGRYDLIVVNYANPDMVGHTGVLAAAIAAVETIDSVLGRLADAIRAAGGVMLITADHGNIEMMRDPQTGTPHTAHTVGVVPAVLVNGPQGAALEDGRLCDIAPTMLALMGLEQPAAMTGRTLLSRAPARMAGASATPGAA